MRLSFFALAACPALLAVALPSPITTDPIRISTLPAVMRLGGPVEEQKRDLAAALSIAAAAVENSTSIDWPATAAGYKVKRSTGPTNAELMQRGLAPSRPQKLYAPRAKRLANAPATASHASNNYRLLGCYKYADVAAQAQGSNTYINAADRQDLANRCAARQDAVPSFAGKFNTFILYELNMCSTLASNNAGTTAEDCAYPNYAVYALN